MPKRTLWPCSHIFHRSNFKNSHFLIWIWSRRWRDFYFFSKHQKADKIKTIRIQKLYIIKNDRINWYLFFHFLICVQPKSLSMPTETYFAHALPMKNAQRITNRLVSWIHAFEIWTHQWGSTYNTVLCPVFPLWPFFDSRKHLFRGGHVLYIVKKLPTQPELEVVGKTWLALTK